jgi:ADP-ribose pyrophosphatase YjhB (NUDIX family)
MEKREKDLISPAPSRRRTTGRNFHTGQQWSYYQDHDTKMGGGGGGGGHKFYDTCNNCGKHGHTFKQCKNPITSYGVIMFRIAPNQERQYLMIRRKDTLGYMDFMRGKYSVSNQKYILNMLQQMTVQEKEKLRKYTFDALWSDLWKEEDLGPSNRRSPKGGSSSIVPGDLMDMSLLSLTECVPKLAGSPPAATAAEGGEPGDDIAEDDTPPVIGDGSDLSPTTCGSGNLYGTYKQEESNSHEKFNYLATKRIADVLQHTNLPSVCHELMASQDTSSWSILHYLIACSEKMNSPEEQWREPEWGFPKGRRNFQEKDYECALREMTEETGYPTHLVKNIKNVLPFDEIILGSNYKSYKHKYYLMYIKYEDSLNTDNYDKSEVSMMQWKSYDECLACIRPYNQEKRRLITHIEQTLTKYRIRGVM